MAPTAIGAQLGAMRIVLEMACSTILRRAFEVLNHLGTCVTAFTFHLGMFSAQFKSNGAMVKAVAISVDPIMTAQTIIPVGLEMGLHEISIDCPVAVRADGLIELGIAIDVTCIAHKRRTIRLALVSG